MECQQNGFAHNRRTRYTHGFFCNDCGKFFPKDSMEYKRHSLLFTLTIIAHNIKTEIYRKHEVFQGRDLEFEKKYIPVEILEIEDSDTPEIKNLPDEELNLYIERVLAILKKYNKDENSANVTIG